MLGVIEQSTGSLSGGIGYSQSQGLFGQVQLAESNLFGNAWDVGTNLTYGQYGALADISWNIPDWRPQPQWPADEGFSEPRNSSGVPEHRRRLHPHAQGLYEPPATAVVDSSAINNFLVCPIITFGIPMI